MQFLQLCAPIIIIFIFFCYEVEVAFILKFRMIIEIFSNLSICEEKMITQLSRRNCGTDLIAEYILNFIFFCFIGQYLHVYK